MLTTTTGTYGKREFSGYDLWGDYDLLGCDLKGDYVFFLSASELMNPEYGMDDPLNRYVPGNGKSWWLRNWDTSRIVDKGQREGGMYDSTGTIVGWNRDGSIGRYRLYSMDLDASDVAQIGYYYTVYGRDYQLGARPAMNLKKDSIAMISAADGAGKSAFAAVTDYADKKWKLTLQTGDTLTGVSLSGSILSENTSITVTAPALSEVGSDYNTLSAMLLDASGKVVAYGSLDESGVLAQPAGLPDGKYTLALRAEQWNGAQQTDYASAPYTETVYIVNGHSHEGQVFQPIQNEAQLAAMTADDWGYLLDDVQVEEGTVYQGHLCLNGRTVSGPMTVRDFALYDDDGTGAVADGLILPGGTLALYGGAVGGTCAVTVKGGSVSFPGTPALNGKTADIYVESGSIDADGIAAPADGAYTVMLESGEGTFCTNWPTGLLAPAYFAGTTGYSVVMEGSELRLVESTHSVAAHPACGASCRHEEDHAVISDWQNLTGIETELSGGSYYLGIDLTLSAPIEITGDVNLCLNGHTLSLDAAAIPEDGTGAVLQVNGGSLTIGDCSGAGSGKITAAGSVDLINIIAGSAVLYGGTLSAPDGDAVQAGASRNDKETTSFAMYGGVIEGCTNGVTGYGTFAMHAGVIRNCTNNGISVQNNVTMDAGTSVTGCKTGVNGSTLTLYSTISDCTNGVYGGSCYMYDGAVVENCTTGITDFTTIEMYEGSIIRSCTEYGVYRPGALRMYGGTITGNGCGVLSNHASYNKILLQGKPVIKGNTKANLAVLRNDAGWNGWYANGVTPNPTGFAPIGIEGMLEEGADVRVRVLGMWDDLSSVTKYGETRDDVATANWNISTYTSYDNTKYITADDSKHVILWDAKANRLRSVALQNTSSAVEQCYLRYDANGGSGSMEPGTLSGWYTKTIDGVNYGIFTTKTNGGKLHANQFTPPEGYVFVGWNLAADRSGREYGPEDHFGMLITDGTPVTLYAQWMSEEGVTVTFDAFGGTCDTASKLVKYQEPYGELPTPTYPGHTFLGWRSGFPNNTKWVDETTIMDKTQNHTLTAAWRANTYTITLDPGEGATCEETVLQRRFDFSYDIADAAHTPKRQGYTFLGWFTEKDGGTEIGENTRVKIPNDHTLYAHWKLDAYTVSFNTNGRGDAPASQDVPAGEKAVKPAAPLVTGYTLDGWYTEAACENLFSFDSEITGDIELFAKWTANTYHVTFDAAGGTCTPAEKEVTYDDVYGELPEASREGYNFAGWFTQKEGGDQVDESTAVTRTLDHTLYAHWTAIPANAPTVTKGEDVSLTYGYAAGTTITVTAPPMAGHDLTYQWYSCDADGGNTAPVENGTAKEYAIPTGKNVGTYYYLCEVAATRRANGEQASIQSDVITVTVDRADFQAAVQMESYTYGGVLPAPSVTANPGNGSVTYYYTDTDTASGGTEWKDMTPTTLNAGTYYLYAQIAESANYNACTTSAMRFTVEKATPAVTAWPTVDGTVYVNDPALTDSRLTGGAAAVKGTFSLNGDKTWTTSGVQTAALLFTPDDQVNYLTVEGSAQVTVTKRTVEAILTALPDIADKDYGTAQDALGLTAAVRIRTADGKTFDNVPIRWTGYRADVLTAQTLIGTLDLTAIADEVTDPGVTAAVTVTLRELTPGQAVLDDKTETYTGSGIQLELAAPVTGVASVKYEYQGKGATEYAKSETAPVNAGTYTVTATFTMEPGYTQIAPVTAALTIEKAAGSVTAPKAAKLTYTGAAQELVTAAVSATGQVEYRLENGSYAAALPKATNAGTYKVYYRVVGDRNHEDVAEQSLTVTIERKSIAIPAADTKAYTYNGKAQTYDLAATVDYTVTGATQTNANEKGYPVTVALTDKANTKWADDTDADLTYSFVIRRKSIAIPAADTKVYTYNGKAQTYGLAATADYTVDGATQTNANEKGYSVTVALTDKANTKWADDTDGDLTYSFVISRKTIAIPAADTKAYTYNGKAQTYDLTATADYTVTGATQTNANEAGHPVTVALTDKENTKWADDTDADLTYSFVISRKTIAIPAADTKEYTYNGKAQTYDLAATADYTVDGATQTNANEAGHPVTVALTDKANTKWADGTDADRTYPFVVKRASITITVEDKSIYMNRELPDLTAPEAEKDYAVSGLIGADALLTGPTLTYDPAQPDVSKPGAAGAIVASGADAGGNYAITYVPGTLTVLKRPSSGGVTTAPAGSTVPVSSDLGSVKVDANVSGGVADVKMDAKQIGQVVAEGKKTGTVTVDVSGLETAQGTKVPAALLEAVNKADSTGLAAATANGTLTLDAAALAGLGSGRALTVYLKQFTDLTAGEKAALDGKAALAVGVEASVVLGTEKQSEFAGKLTVSIPYEAKAGEDTNSLAVWSVRADGSVKDLGGRYDAKNKCFVFETDQLSRFLLVNELKAENDFADVADGAYYAEAAAWAAESGIASGVGGGKFAPDRTCTRGEIVTFLWRAAGSPEPKTTVNPFRDVAQDAYCYQAVLWAVEHDIAQGIGSGKFSPDTPCTRTQAVTFLFRGAAAQGMDAVTLAELLGGFADGDTVPDYGVAAMNWAVAAGLVQGDGGNLRPNDPCTRAQIVTMLYRMERKA